MSLPPVTYNLDIDGDVYLVLLNGDMDHEDQEFSDSDTVVDDASSVGTEIIDSAIANESNLEGQAGQPHESASHGVVRYRVESYRLRSSPVFRRLLFDNVGSPGLWRQLQFPTRLHIQNDDPLILHRVLHLVHQDGKIQPESAEVHQLFPAPENDADDLMMLARMAVVVDKYQLHAAVDDYVTGILKKMWKNMDGASIADAVAWVWIAWVFKLTDHFEAATAYLAKNATTALESDVDAIWPLPSQILGAIDRTRADALAELYTLFLSHLDSLINIAVSSVSESGPESVPKENNFKPKADSCGIGMLMYQGFRLGFWPHHEGDLLGISYMDVAKAIRSPHCSPCGNLQKGKGGTYHCWGPLAVLLECQEERQWALAMEDFE